MKKRLLVILICCLVSSSLFAEGLGPFDLGFTFGTRSHFFEKEDTSKLSMQYGLTLGLSEIYELDVTMTSQLIPNFFGDNCLQVMIMRSLLGDRNSGTAVAGMGYNILFGAGVGFTTYNSYGKFYPTHILVSLTPIAAGSPSLGKRERALTLTLGINMYTQQVSLYLDILTDDFYVLGTYKDHPLKTPSSSSPKP